MCALGAHSCRSLIHEDHVVILTKVLKFSYSLVYINGIGREKERKTRCRQQNVRKQAGKQEKSGKQEEIGKH